MRLALKVDVDTLRGTREGVPRLVELFRRHGVGATFLFRHLPQTARVGDDAGAAGGHGLERNQPERLVDGRHDADVGDRVERMQDVVADPAHERAVLHQAQILRLTAELLLVRARSGHDEPGVRKTLDDLRQRLQRKLEALLVDQPADEQDQALVLTGELGAELPQALVILRLEVTRVDPVWNHLDLGLGHAEHVHDLLAHEGGAGDHAVGAVGDPLLDPVDVDLRMLVDPSLVAAVLGRVDGGHERRPEAARQVCACVGHKPVVAVDDVEVMAVSQLHPRSEHVRVHALDPGDELVQVRGAGRLPDPVHVDAVHLLLGGRLLAPAGQYVHLHAAADQTLGQLDDVPGQASLDQRRVLPGEDQDAHGTRKGWQVTAPSAEPGSGPAPARAGRGQLSRAPPAPPRGPRRGRSHA